MALKDIKTKIKSVKRTGKVTKAMEAVSAVKMRKSQVRAISGRPYAVSALSILDRLAPSLSAINHPLTQKREEVRRAALIVVTSDKGLCGVLNAAALKEANRKLTELGLPKESVEIFALGRKAAEHFERRGFTLAERFENISDDVSVEDVERIARAATQGFSDGTYDRVDIIYTNFKSTFEQEAVCRRVLPLSAGAFQDVVKSITPEKGKFANGEAVAPSFYTAEPSEDEVLAKLLPRLTAIIFYHALLESKASEHSARMVAMKNASDKSKEVSKLLTREFNKVRQAAITREVSEIVGGIEAMAA